MDLRNNAKKIAPTLLVIVLGVIVTVFATVQAGKMQRRQSDALFEARAELLVDRVQGRVDQALQSGRDLLALFGSQAEADTVDFQSIVESFSSLKEYRKAIFIWNVDTENDGVTYNGVWQWRAEGSTDLSGLTQNVVLRHFVDQLVERGGMTAIPVPQGFVAAATGELLLFSTFENAVGKTLVVQAIDGAALFQDVAKGRRFQGIEFQAYSLLEDPVSDEELELETAFSAGLQPESDAAEYLISVHSFQLGDQSWNAVLWSEEANFDRDNSRIIMTFSFSVILTVLVAYIVALQSLRTERIAAIVDRRTKALTKANEELASQTKLLKDLNQDLDNSREEAEAANKAKSEFLATMSHELRTPLNSILGFSQIFKDQSLGPLGDNRYADYAKDIHSSGSHLLGVINDVLDIAKLEAGHMSIEYGSVSLAYLLDSARATVAPGMEGKDVELSFSLSDELPEYVRADELRLRQIVINLVSNSAKFTNEGHIRVSLNPAELDGKPAYRLSVEDTGIGIPKDKQPRLFERFSQIDSALSRKHGGTGLGLAICRELAERMGGTIEAVSEVGKGTTMMVTLPLIEVSDADKDDQMLI
jgi:signal transduction histidine kinase